MTAAELDPGAAERVSSTVLGVIRQALHDHGAERVLVLDDGSDEARLVLGWCGELGARVSLAEERAGTPPAGDLLRLSALGSAEPDRAALAEVLRFFGRLRAARERGLLAHPANKTVLLLADAVPPEPLLPAGDLFASRVRELAGGWTGPPEVVELATAAGGIDPLDRALIALLERREAPEAALGGLPRDVALELTRRLRAGRPRRRRIGLIPKLGTRTIGVDLLP